VLRLLRARGAAAALAGLAAGVGGGFALGDALGGQISAPPGKAAALARLASVATTDANTEPAAAPQSAAHPIPGQMLAADAPVPIAPSVLQVRNGWLVSDAKTLVAVYAGAAGNDASVGRVVIVRQNLAAGRQSVSIVDAGETGALTIATAPLGSAVETSAQVGTLGLRTPAGGQVRLDLRTGTVSPAAHGTPLR
jgi:hypothetical protein